jgi:hypothetical protein
MRKRVHQKLQRAKAIGSLLGCSRWMAALLLALHPAYACEAPERVAERLLLAYGSTTIRPSVHAAESAGSLAQNGVGAIAPDLVEAQLYIDRFTAINQRDQAWGMDGYSRTCGRGGRTRHASLSTAHPAAWTS